MASLTFKSGSVPYTLHQHFSNGGSLTFVEAMREPFEIIHITQRVADLHKKFVDAGAVSPLMVIDEKNDRGGVHARYFYAGAGCEHEWKEGARKYKEG